MNTVRFPRNLRLAFSLVFGFAIAGISAARAQEFVFTKIVDSNDPIPGGAGALFVPAEQPALDGGTIIFRNGNTLAPDAIWSVTGGAFTKLVDLNTSRARWHGEVQLADSRFLRAGVSGIERGHGDFRRA